MPDCFFLDFETYYDQEYSLSKMSTEDYVADPRFELIMVSIKRNNEPIGTLASTDIAEYEKLFDECGLWKGMVVAHNMMFDGLILAHHFRRLPKMLSCTKMMANPFIKPFVNTVSLEACLDYINSPIRKGKTVIEMKGRHLASLSRRELLAYIKYCENDTDGLEYLFRWLLPKLSAKEMHIIDMTLRMYLEPTFELNATELAENLQLTIAKKEAQLNALPEGVTKSKLASNPQFAEVLKSYNVEPPQKISPATGELTFAFAKSDPGWKELEQEYEDDPVIAPILAARLGVKSTLEVTRSQRLLNIANTHKKFRVPLMYYAAHTGRYGGTEGINAQNLPRVDKSRIRFSVTAPKGHVVIAADLEQIEARITAWLAKQHDLTEDFRQGRDIYAKFASRIFHCDVVKDRSKEDNRKRFVGKTCILGLGYGMGAVKLQATLKKDNLEFDILQTTNMVNTYRETYEQIPALWQHLNKLIPMLASTGAMVHKISSVATVRPRQLILVNGMPIQYHGIRFDNATQQWTYRYNREVRSIWGGKMLENLVQALARIKIMSDMVLIREATGFRPALQQHDELDYVIHARDINPFEAEVRRIMTAPPEWAPDLPLSVSVAYGNNLGECK